MRCGADRMVVMMDVEIKAAIIALSVANQTIENMERAITQIKKEMKVSTGYIHDISRGCDEVQWQEVTEFAKLHKVQL